MPHTVPHTHTEYRTTRMVMYHNSQYCIMYYTSILQHCTAVLYRILYYTPTLHSMKRIPTAPAPLPIPDPGSPLSLPRPLTLTQTLTPLPGPPPAPAPAPVVRARMVRVSPDIDWGVQFDLDNDAFGVDDEERLWQACQKAR